MPEEARSITRIAKWGRIGTQVPERILGITEVQIAKLRQYRASIQRRAEPGYQDEVKQINEQIAEVMTSLNREVNRVKKEAATN